MPTSDTNPSVSKPEFLPFGAPSIGEEEIEAVVEVLQSGWLTTGAKARQFEEAFAEYVGAKYAVALNSCTAALHLALEAMGIGEGDGVLIPTMTFAATGEVVRYMRAIPILVDCEPDTLNIDVGEIERILEQECEQTSAELIHRATGAKIRAVIPVHYGGLMCDMDHLCKLADRYHLRILEDAAHALPTSQNGRMAGSIGTAGAYSFYANKTITTGEGGMLVTNDQALADRARIMSLHGISRDAWLRYTEKGSWYYEIVAPGYKYNITDIAAALGIVQLKRCEEMWIERQRLAERYTRGFLSNFALQLPVGAPTGGQHAWHLYPIQLHLNRLKIDRAQFIEELKARGIGCSVHYLPLHMHPYYRETFGTQPSDFPVARQAYERIITLPLYSKMAEADVDRVIHDVNEIVHLNRA
jgi:perosamine synthetase